MNHLRSILAVAILALGLAPAGASALTFTTAPGSPLTQPAPSSVTSDLATGDFNGDGRTDIARVGSTDKIFVYLGQADGTFTAGVSYGSWPFSANRRWIATGDVNGDSKLDLVVSVDLVHGEEDNDPTDPVRFETYLGAGDGSFPATGNFATTMPSGVGGEAGADSSALGDVNGDGKLDLVTGMYDHSFSVALGSGTGSFTPTAASPINVPTPTNSAQDGVTSIALADFGGAGPAGAVDVAMVMRGETSGNNGIYVATGGGDGTLSPIASPLLTAPSDVPFSTVAKVDLNGSFADLSITQRLNAGNSLRTMVGSASGLVVNPGAGSLDPGFDPNRQSVMDVNGDGHQDILVGLESGGAAAVILSDGTGDLLPAKGSPFSFDPIGPHFKTHSIEAGDFNGDGFKDLAADTSSTNVAWSGVGVLLNRPSPSVSPDDSNFPVTAPGQTSAPVTFTLTNDQGAPPLNPTTLEFEDPVDGTRYIVDSTDCNRVLQGGESCNVVVQFAPTSGGTFFTHLVFKFGTQASNISVILDGTTGFEEGEITPNNPLLYVDLGDAIAGYEPSYITKAFTIKSTGNKPLTVASTSFVEADTDMDVFSLVDPNACDGQIQPGQTCDIEVRYAPTAPENAANFATLEVDTPGYLGGPLDVVMVGFATVPSHSVAPGSLDFGSVAVGSAAAATRTFKLTSDGEGLLPVLGYRITGPNADSFSAPPGQCPAMLDRGSACDIEVAFDPNSGGAGVRSATLNLDVFSPGGAPKTVSLAGTATAGSGDGTTGSGASALSLTLKSPKKAKRGKPLAVKATVGNTGGTSARSLVLKTKVPKKFAKTPKPIKVSSLAAGESLTRKIKIKVKRSAAVGKMLKAKVTLSAAGVKSTKAKIRPAVIG